MHVSATETLRLHTDDEGIVWMGKQGISAFRTGLSPSEWIAADEHHGGASLRDAQQIRILGVPENAELITEIHEMWQVNNDYPPRIYIGSPGVCLHAARRGDPAFVLSQIWQPCIQSQACGCWHEFTPRDYPTYLMLKLLQQNNGQVHGSVKKILPYHPAWPAISFIPTHNVEFACKLLCEIVDPRWYSHPERPGRFTRLWAYLGVEPYHFHMHAKPDDLHQARADIATAAWCGKTFAQNVDLDDPRQFLLRIYRREGFESGLLKATKKFLQFLCLVWSQGVLAVQREIFVPSIFFKREDEVAAYAAHLRQLEKRV
jgi:hypothetical protein